MSDDTTSTAATVVRYEQTGAVVLVTIDRPAQLNAINGEVRAGLFAAFRRFEADDSARVAILTGAGAKAFCRINPVVSVDLLFNFFSNIGVSCWLFILSSSRKYAE